MSNQYFARCMKCRKQMEVQNPEVITTKNGGRAVRGTCVCGTKMYKFLPKEKSNLSSHESKTIPSTSNTSQAAEPMSPFISPIINDEIVKEEKISHSVKEEVKEWDESQI